MDPTYFTKAEAQAEVGKCVRPRRDRVGVPTGATGTVVNAHVAFQWVPAGGPVIDIYEVGIQQDLPLKGMPRMESFSKDVFQYFFVQIA